MGAITRVVGGCTTRTGQLVEEIVSADLAVWKCSVTGFYLKLLANI